MFLEEEQMFFQDRQDAGRKLAESLQKYANRKDVIVLGIPRGGVPVASEIAKLLNAPLDIFVSRKLGVPGQEELAFGAIASGGMRVLDREIIEGVGISEQQIEQITEKAKKELERREKLYRGDRPPLKLEGQTVILVDDGIATGSSMLAGIRALKQLRPAQIVVAAPVAPAMTCNRLKPEVDELVCVQTPRSFYAIGQFYVDFSQISDGQVTELLQKAATPILQQTGQDDPHPRGMERSATMIPVRKPEFNIERREVSLDVEGVTLEGSLAIPDGAEGIVLFAHGSGSSRHSPRNRFVAQSLQSERVATLLFDLLTRKEESIDQYTGELRFDIPFLAKRLMGATKWIMDSPETKHLKIGYFGASTGAGAALVAAAKLPEAISTVVSRGGRPDLAHEALAEVRASTLLIVGGEDHPVITMNQDALARLGCRDKKLVIVPGATHLFEEAGTLEEVARVAAEWFSQHFVAAKKAHAHGTAASL